MILIQQHDTQHDDAQNSTMTLYAQYKDNVLCSPDRSFMPLEKTTQKPHPVMFNQLHLID
jgi:hypothetical protein